MEQANQTSDQPRLYQQNGHKKSVVAATPAMRYEEKVKTINFDAEANNSDSESEAAEWQRQNFAALAASNDGRQRSRVVTHPVIRTTALPMPPAPADSFFQARPASPSASSSYLTASTQWSAQSSVARKTAASSRRGFQHQHEVGWRPKSMDFRAEMDSSDSESEWLPETARPRYNHDQENSRHRSRVMTRPVVKTTMLTGHNPTASVYAPVRTRPVSPSALSSNYTFGPTSQQSQLEQSTAAPSHWSTQSVVARKVASSQKSAKKPKKQRQRPTPTGQQSDSDTHRPRSSSESSFGRLFFAWRRPQYSKQEAAAGVETADEASRESSLHQQPAEYRGKNVHNFSYVDAKIYSPESQQQQQQMKQHPDTIDSRTKTWWTMETMSAVNSVYSNQIMLAREAPTTSVDAFPR